MARRVVAPTNWSEDGRPRSMSVPYLRRACRAEVLSKVEERRRIAALEALAIFPSRPPGVARGVFA